MPTQALLLVLTAACIHATWNLLAKRVRGGMEVVWLYSCVGAIVYGPWAITEYAREWDRLGWREAGSIAGSCFWQLAYFVCLQNAYRHGDLSLVYPVARGSGPLVAALGALAIFGETPTASAWMGISLISGGVLFFLRAGAGVGWGLATGLLIGIYSLWDKNAVSGLHLPPVLMEWTTDLSRAIVLAPLALRRHGETAGVWKRDRLRLVLIGAMNPLSYILVLTALTMAPLHRVAPLREISIVLGAILGARFLGEQQGRRRLAGALVMVAGVLFLTGCSAERPAFQPKYERGIDLRVAVPPALPAAPAGEGDEAEIQFRAAQSFYRAGRWNFAIPALSEALDHDDDRQDIRYYLAAALVMAGRDADAAVLLDELLETPWASRARALYARVLYRTGKGREAREMAAEAAKEDFDAAGWLARYDLLFGPEAIR
ncbi:MAG TPA: EamA family transporter [Bryobacteraceae bacterium]|nr:EamA family transporter [Bryobacteraceae bacterium]